MKCQCPCHTPAGKGWVFSSPSHACCDHKFVLHAETTFGVAVGGVSSNGQTLAKIMTKSLGVPWCDFCAKGGAHFCPKAHELSANLEWYANLPAVPDATTWTQRSRPFGRDMHNFDAADLAEIQRALALGRLKHGKEA